MWQVSMAVVCWMMAFEDAEKNESYAAAVVENAGCLVVIQTLAFSTGYRTMNLNFENHIMNL